MASFLSKIFGTKNDKDLKHLRPILEKVNSFSKWAEGLSDNDFPIQTEKFKQRLKNGENLNQILPEAFALAREAANRTLKERHYDVQIMGAIVLHEGKILEMKTGEGKTLTCVPAAYLNALEGKGVHVITVNDYLAQRDADWMRPIYEFLGLSVGAIVSNMDNERRRDAYSRDVTYGTNNEFGFDYLRDNMKYRLSDKIQPKHHFCIIDEIDSILIDESRTPLIISGPADDDTEKARNAEKIVSYFKEVEKDPNTGEYPVVSPLERFDATEKTEIKGDFQINEKQKRVTFTNEGMSHMEELLKKFSVINGSLYDDENFEYSHYVTQAMVARHLYKKDVDYVVVDGQIQIVDEFTGRILYGRRYSEGLHQAIEAKEHIRIQGRSRTLATITYQNFFRMYDKLSGMTGTADTEAAEFNSIYGLDVVVIPTNVPIQRKDNDDLVFLTESFKLKAICEEIKRVHETGQPILVGTISIERSEQLSALMNKMGIKHNVLNAKNHAREAVIIGEAGAKGAVTIATNMAGRGTDIKLGGSIDHLAWKICGTDASNEEFIKAKETVRPKWEKAYKEVKELGGLYILGTERHESRRIDNQLRGRSGRQGDPGVSKFFVSFDDTLMRLFAKDSIKPMLSRLGMNDGEPLAHSMVSKVIEKAQTRVEERNFDIRKHLLEYDDVLNEQRNFIYSQRNEILEDTKIIQRVKDSISEFISYIVENNSKLPSEQRFSQMVEDCRDLLAYEYVPVKEDEKLSSDELIKKLSENIFSEINEKVELAGEKNLNDFLRFHYLHNIDSRWQNHLEELEALRDAVNLRAYAQKNPLVEYKLEGYDIFEKMIEAIKGAVCKILIRVKIQTKPADYASRVGNRRMQETHHSSQAFGQNMKQRLQETRNAANNGKTAQVQIVRNTPKVGRNDPCPCGSGKKYKNCCLKKQQMQ